MLTGFAFPKPGKKRKKKNPLKRMRKSSPKVLKHVKTFACAACGQMPGNKSNPIDPSHIKTKGSGGPDAFFNVLPKCRKCHREWGRSWVKFLEKYPNFKAHLKRLGWSFTDVTGAPRLSHRLLVGGASE